MATSTTSDDVSMDPVVLFLEITDASLLTPVHRDLATVDRLSTISRVLEAARQASILPAPADAWDVYVGGSQEPALGDTTLADHVPEAFAITLKIVLTDGRYQELFDSATALTRVMSTPRIYTKLKCGLSVSEDLHFHRDEDDNVLRILREHAATWEWQGKKNPLVLVGSTGVGKSSMADDLALALSHDACELKKRDVLCIRAGPRFDFFSRNGSKISGPLTLHFSKLLSLLKMIEGNPRFTPYVIMDGFESPTDMPDVAYDVFVTSGVIDEKKMGQRVIMLSSWNREDVIKIFQELKKPCRRASLKARILVGLLTVDPNKRYSLCGGDLRLCLNPDNKAVTYAVNRELCKVNFDNAHKLQSTIGRCDSDQVGIRRYYILNPEKDGHYQDSRRWIGLIESVVARRYVAQCLSSKEMDQFLNFAVDTKLYGDMYEIASHTYACRNSSMKFSVKRVLSQATQIKPIASGATASSGVPPSSSDEKCGQDKKEPVTIDQLMSVNGHIVVDTSVSAIDGDKIIEAVERLGKFVSGKKTYWAPRVSNFTAIDAVANVTLRSADGNEIKAIGLLQYTVAKNKILNPTQISAVTSAVVDEPVNTKSIAATLRGKEAPPDSPTNQERAKKRFRSGSPTDAAGSQASESQTKEQPRSAPDLPKRKTDLPVVLIFVTMPGHKIEYKNLPDDIVAYEVEFDPRADINFSHCDTLTTSCTHHVLRPDEDSVEEIVLPEVELLSLFCGL